MKNKTEEHALKMIGKLAARKVSRKRIARATRAYYKTAGRDMPEEISEGLQRVSTRAM